MSNHVRLLVSFQASFSLFRTNTNSDALFQILKLQIRCLSHHLKSRIPLLHAGTNILLMVGPIR